MARRYDTRTTTFSPEGRLYQVEYALEAINNAASTIGITTTEGVVLAAEKMETSKLLDPGRTSEKIYKIDEHVICAVAGLTSDANILIESLRETAQSYRYVYQEPQPVQQLIISICDKKQLYTQWGGLRPFGVSFLFAGWDVHHGFQLYHTDPSGNYNGYQATAIGINNQTAQSILKQEWKDNLTLEEGLQLAAKVLTKTMDTASPSPEKLEFATLSEVNGKLVYKIVSDSQVNSLMEHQRLPQAPRS
eukprot:GHVL01024016.1.p1 GENE.GHVL01024016.1~~GHVL01024016.1.p1  ORF type:complete len:248 (+),score=35.74 GHVL01024016.1:34-777(+)